MKKLYLLVVILVFAVSCGKSDTPETTDEIDEITEATTEISSGILSEITPIEQPPGVMYSLTADAWLQSARVGDSGGIDVLNGSPYFRQSGNPSFTVTDTGANETKAILISNRNSAECALEFDINALNLNMAGGTYMLTIKGSISGAGTMCIFGADGGYVFDSVEIGDENGGEFILWTSLNSITVFAHDETGIVRLGTHPETVDIYINEIMVSYEMHPDFPRPENVIYSLSTDPLIQLLEIGTSGYRNIFNTPYLSDAGQPTYTIVEGPFGNAIQITNREHNNYAVDFVTDMINWDLNNYTYAITLRGLLQGGGTGLISGADSPWNYLASMDTEEDGNFVVRYLIGSNASLEEAGSRKWLRMQSECTKQLTIFEIMVERQ